MVILRASLGWLVGCSLCLVVLPAEARVKSELGVLVVDLQQCFIEGGALAVPGANQSYVKQVKESLRWLSIKHLLLVASKDYHPEGHISFASSHAEGRPYESITLHNGRQQMLWPDHCVQTRGDSRLVIDNNILFETIKKGQYQDADSNSAFQDDAGRKTELDALLKEQGIRTLIIFGLAIEVCVLSTIKHAVEAGYHVVFVNSLSRGLNEQDVLSAEAEMRAMNVKIVRSTREMKTYVINKLRAEGRLSSLLKNQDAF